ncbi:MAG: hypothetical protein AAAC47_21110 [Pararhizobium sp.]
MTAEQLAAYNAKRGGYAPPHTEAKAPVRKYRNQPTEGHASKKEHARAVELRLLETGGYIRKLREQVPFVLIQAQDGERACTYIADFVYEEEKTGEWREVVEDAKSPATSTPAYVIKRKLMLYVLGIRVRET